MFITSFIASRIRYEITSGNIGGAFAVKNMTGAIYVAGALDYETRKRVSRKFPIISKLLQQQTENPHQFFTSSSSLLEISTKEHLLLQI